MVNSTPVPTKSHSDEAPGTRRTACPHTHYKARIIIRGKETLSPSSRAQAIFTNVGSCFLRCASAIIFGSRPKHFTNLPLVLTKLLALLRALNGPSERISEPFLTLEPESASHWWSLSPADNSRCRSLDAPQGSAAFFLLLIVLEVSASKEKKPYLTVQMRGHKRIPQELKLIQGGEPFCRRLTPLRGLKGQRPEKSATHFPKLFSICLILNSRGGSYM